MRVPESYKIGKCIVCKNDLTDYKMGMRAKRTKLDGSPTYELHVYHSKCSYCEIHYTNSNDELPKNWKCTDIREEELFSEVNEEQVDKIVSTYKKSTDEELLELLKDKLDEFLSIKKAGDVFYTYAPFKHDMVIKGLAIKRDQFIIGDWMYHYEYKQRNKQIF